MTVHKYGPSEITMTPFLCKMWTQLLLIQILKEESSGEREIMTKTKDPLVSICCITYNHENYIRDAIEGFLMQETDFPFEIVIHDDASTDATADIIREYERKYPDIIKPIYQTENQHSKGERATLFTFKAARGKYIALCEGDDYWVDPLKLQKQITEMEKHPECYISFHPAIQRWVDGSREDRVLGLHSDKITIFSTEEVILGKGGFMHTASIILNRLTIPRIVSFFDIAKEAPVGDYYIQVLGAEHGGALYLSDVMSVYRSGIPGSWSERVRKDPSHIVCSRSHSYTICYHKMNVFTKKKYSKLFDILIKQHYSDLIRSLYLNIDTKKSIIDADMSYIDAKDLILWNLIFKHQFIVKILHGMHQLALQALSRRNRRHFKGQESLEKTPSHDTMGN
jgi:glycosyltransferase involved in cell wall biosynthesis